MRSLCSVKKIELKKQKTYYPEFKITEKFTKDSEWGKQESGKTHQAAEKLDDDGFVKL